MAKKLCKVCRVHESKKRRRCLWCCTERALPDCRPQRCWVRTYGNERGFCKDCAHRALHIPHLIIFPKLTACEPTELIFEFAGLPELQAAKEIAEAQQWHRELLASC